MGYLEALLHFPLSALMLPLREMAALHLRNKPVLHGLHLYDDTF